MARLLKNAPLTAIPVDRETCRYAASTPGFELFWSIPFRLLPNKTRSGLAYGLLKVPCLCLNCLGYFGVKEPCLDPTGNGNNPGLTPDFGDQHFQQPARFAYSLPGADGALRNLKSDYRTGTVTAQDSIFDRRKCKTMVLGGCVLVSYRAPPYSSGDNDNEITTYQSPSRQ